MQIPGGHITHPAPSENILRPRRPVSFDTRLAPLLPNTTMVSPSLPSELLYKIVLFTATNYIDDLVAGPLSIPHTGLDVPHTAAELEALRVEIDKSDPALRVPSPLRSLFCASYQLRSIALKVLSHVLGIDMVTGPANLPQ